MERMMRKARRVRDRLGASESLFDLIWEKPKGMHWKMVEIRPDLERKLLGSPGRRLKRDSSPAMV